MVVEGYHKGFTRSIQNYSQILALFQDARQQVRACSADGAHAGSILPALPKQVFT